MFGVTSASFALEVQFSKKADLAEAHCGEEEPTCRNRDYALIHSIFSASLGS